jgi:hypothetical protein
LRQRRRPEKGAAAVFSFAIAPLWDALLRYCGGAKTKQGGIKMQDVWQYVNKKPIPVVERLRAEIIRLAAAAGAEGNGTTALEDLRRLEDAVHLLKHIATVFYVETATPEKIDEAFRLLR